MSHNSPQNTSQDYKQSPMIVIASNRGPFSFSARKDGSFRVKRGAGGLVTALGALAEEHDVLWIASALSRGDRAWAIGLFVRHFGVDMSEAGESDHERYANFNEFFTRPLKDGVRPIADADIVCPADGAISQLGDIREGLCFQAKGKYFSTEELLAGDEARAAQFAGGRFAT